jgi:hypothetical protein
VKVEAERLRGRERAQARLLGSDPVGAEPRPSGRPPPGERAVRAFTLPVLDTAGDAGDVALRTFSAAASLGAYTLSTLTGAPVDEQLRAFA